MYFDKGKVPAQILYGDPCTCLGRSIKNLKWNHAPPPSKVNNIPFMSVVAMKETLTSYGGFFLRVCTSSL